MNRKVIVLEGPVACGKTTIANLIAAGPEVWQVVDFGPHTSIGVRELAKHPNLIICCHEVNAKKFHHWWATLLADAQVFYWRLERQDIVLKKPTTITFKKKHI